ncbi:MAG: formate/nitrite transporter family protein [Clostridia bacterium]|nr:formate/nitrite transporter family protein [Clostridia bacterium]
MIKLIRHSIVSGILVGIGVLINTIAENPVVGSFLFSLALLTIIKNGFTLYTGKIGFIRDIPLQDLAIMLIFNFVGIFLTVYMIIPQRETVMAAMQAAANAKFGHDFLYLFTHGIMCGALMFIAVYSKEPLITVMSIMAFILSGFEHCIADFPYLFLVFSPVNLLKFVVIILGNSVGSVLLRLLFDGRKEKNLKF